jgi:GTPase SAR1 family protein
MAKEYDYLLKVLLVGDSDVGKTEILNNMDDPMENEEGEEKKQNNFYGNRSSDFFLQQLTRLQSFY